MPKFKRMTAAQRKVYAALRALGSMWVSPNDARPLRALHKRGLVRYTRDQHGARLAVLKETKAQKALKRKLKRASMWFGWPNRKA